MQFKGIANYETRTLNEAYIETFDCDTYHWYELRL